MKKVLIVSVLFSALFAVVSATASFFHFAKKTPLSVKEQQIANIARQQQSAQLALLEKLVNIPSGTSNIAGVQKIGKILQTQFNQIGFKTRWVAEPASMKRAGTFIAERKGTKGKRILLIGHLDTVFANSSPFKKFIRQGNVAKGPGVVDDKGGDVVILFALKALYLAHALDDATVTVVLTGDEEDSGKPTSISRKPLFRAAAQSDVALDFEGATSVNTLSTSRRGITRWALYTTGNQEHSAVIFQPSVGDGAIFELARILNTMRTQLVGEKNLTFSPGIILGGTTVDYNEKNSQGKAFGKENVIASKAMAQGDLRFRSTEQEQNVEKDILSTVKQHLLGTDATMKFSSQIPAMPSTANNMALLKQYSVVSQDLGYGSVKPFTGDRGAGDISHIAALVSANLVGLGAQGSGMHSLDETLEVNGLPIQTQRAAVFIYRLIGEKS